MSSRSDREFIDPIGNNLPREDETLFIPVSRDGFPDNLSGFWGGILLGIGGGALIPHAPWLSGLLIAAGYGMTTNALAGSKNRLSRALRFGFGLSAAAGAALVLGEVLFPRSTMSFIAAAGERHLIFCGAAAMPWMIGLVRFIYRLFRG